MPYFSTKSAAGIEMLKQVRDSLLEARKLRDPEKLLEIARPITSKMIQLRPSLTKEFEPHLPIKPSMFMSLISFLGSMVLHLLFVCIYHRYKHKHCLTPLWCGLFARKTPSLPVLSSAYSVRHRLPHFRAKLHSWAISLKMDLDKLLVALVLTLRCHYEMVKRPTIIPWHHCRLTLFLKTRLPRIIMQFAHMNRGSPSKRLF